MGKKRVNILFDINGSYLADDYPLNKKNLFEVLHDIVYESVKDYPSLMRPKMSSLKIFLISKESEFKKYKVSFDIVGEDLHVLDSVIPDIIKEIMSMDEGYYEQKYKPPRIPHDMNTNMSDIQIV